MRAGERVIMVHTAHVLLCTGMLGLHQRSYAHNSLQEACYDQGCYNAVVTGAVHCLLCSSWQLPSKLLLTAVCVMYQH
jgi:hypothetical protein